MEWPLQGDFVIVADVIAIGLDLISILVLKCLAEPHPKCEADGTYLCVST